MYTYLRRFISFSICGPLLSWSTFRGNESFEFAHKFFRLIQTITHVYFLQVLFGWGNRTMVLSSTWTCRRYLSKSFEGSSDKSLYHFARHCGFRSIAPVHRSNISGYINTSTEGSIFERYIKFYFVRSLTQRYMAAIERKQCCIWSRFRLFEIHWDDCRSHQ